MKRIFILLTVLTTTLTAAAQNPEFEKRSFVSKDGTSLNYRILTPENNAAGKKFPLVIFLHGSGERGEDNERQLIHGGQMFLNPVNREKYPAYVIFPQCPSDEFWAFRQRPGSFDSPWMDQDMPPILQAVKEMIDSYIGMPEIDKDRVYIMGLSMGGMGTFNLVSHHPELFAAAIPICGISDTAILPAARDIKFRIYHGDADDVVAVKHSREAYKTLKAAGAKVEYFEFPGCNHGSWNPAFSQPDFMEWLFKQKKGRRNR